MLYNIFHYAMCAQNIGGIFHCILNINLWFIDLFSSIKFAFNMEIANMLLAKDLRNKSKIERRLFL